MKNACLPILLLTALFHACTKEFEEINTNSNAPIEVQSELLLRQVIYNLGEEMSYEGFVAGNLLSQHLSMVDFNLFDRHNLSQPQLGGNPWPVLYRNLRDNEILLRQARSTMSDAVYEGPALILKAYIAAALTDIYGDVPYSQAVQGKTGNVQPAYDDQESIYTAPNGILNNLDRGIEALEAYQGIATLEGDILFGGDLNGWIRLAHSLKIKYLVRISSRQDVSEELQRLFIRGDFIGTNAENATFDFTDAQPNNFRMATLRSGDFNLFVMSETSESLLKRSNDPRISVFFRPFESDSAGSQYNGLLNGQDASQTSITVSDYSLAGTAFRERSGMLDANFMTAWETLFFLAEAAHHGLISADDQTLYERAVELAFEYWHTPLPTSYLLSDSAAYGSFGQDPLEQIITQKWIANSMNGYEAWIEYRRTGFPRLMQIAASLNNDLIPVRMPYPTDEAALNAANYSQAAANTSGNSVNARVWWDR